MERTGTDGDTMQETPASITTNHSDAPGVTVNRHTVRTALRSAEKLADDANLMLREAERERDNAVRRLGKLQERVDALHQEREFRTRHVQDLLDAVS